MSVPGRCAIALVASAIALGLASCGSDEDATEAESSSRVDLLVGDIVPRTGPGAPLGVSAQKSAQLAVEEINDAIGQADVEHTIEIVHQDENAKGAEQAARALLDSGAGCVIGPWARPRMRQAARSLRGQDVLVISPQATLRRHVLTIPGGRAPQETLSSESTNPEREDPSAAFARLFASTDPPISPALRTDARQFDAAIVCYLAAVAAGDSAGRAMRAAITGPAAARPFNWLHLPDAIEALDAGRAITYDGLTTRLGFSPQ